MRRRNIEDSWDKLRNVREIYCLGIKLLWDERLLWIRIVKVVSLTWKKNKKNQLTTTFSWIFVIIGKANWVENSWWSRN